MYLVICKAGHERGACWEIGDRPLLIGRGSGCDIVVEDALVSRKHCEILAEGERLLLRDLDSSNATLLNGKPVKRSSLHVGDELGIGSDILLIGRVAQPEGGDTEDLEEPETNRVRIGEPACLLEAGGAAGAWSAPRTVPELAELFSVGNAVSQATSIPGIITTLLQRLAEHYTGDRVWIVLYKADTKATDIYPAREADRLRQNDGLFPHVQQTLQHPLAKVLSDRISKRTVGSYMIAPITLAMEVLGAVVVQADTKQQPFDSDALSYLQAVAYAAAPFIRALDRMAQLELERGARENARQNYTGNFIGTDKNVARIRSLVKSCARSNLNTLIIGETGTGKELVARMIHASSERSAKSIITVNCAAIPDGLFESEVFGHESGAFTGAHSRKLGLFEEAGGSTLFLDEVGDLSPANQGRLLRAIETGSFRRLGGTADLYSQCVVVSATNKDLRMAIAGGAFRQDLFHRLNAFEIRVPPLRDRKSDIASLASHFLHEANARFSRNLQGFEPEAIAMLEAREWPGNVRELKNTVERALAVASGHMISSEDLAATVLPENEFTFDGLPLLPLAEIERRHIQTVLDACKGNMQEAADILRIGRSTIYRKIEEYGIVIQAV